MTSSDNTQQPAKPPPLVIGVTGIEPKPIVLTPEPTLRVNWGAVATLPPFQMYACERFGRSTGDSHVWATECAIREAAVAGDQALLDAYARWHGAKGYWPNEDPLGRSN